MARPTRGRHLQPGRSERPPRDAARLRGPIVSLINSASETRSGPAIPSRAARVCTVTPPNRPALPGAGPHPPEHHPGEGMSTTTLSEAAAPRQGVVREPAPVLVLFDPDPAVRLFAELAR